MSRMTWGEHLGVAARVGLLLTLMPVTSFGLGLGPIKVKSALNETLNAEIAFISITDRELKDLQVGLAPEGAFKVAGIERHPRLTAIEFKIERDDNGRPYLHVTTRFPYPEPYLHFLLQAEWTVGGSVGRLRREYTALIDPPFLTASKPNGVRAPRTPEFTSEKSEPELTLGELTPDSTSEPELLIEEEPESKVVVAKNEEPELLLEEEPELLLEEEAAPQKMPSDRMAKADVVEEPALDLDAAADESLTLTDLGATVGEAELLGPPDHLLPGGSPEWANTNSYRVKRGDTAYSIAKKIRNDRSLTVEQVVVALYDSNPKAFFGNNTNNLRAGKILKIPEREIFEKRSRSNANRKFRAHYDSWQEYKLKLASAKQPVSLGEPPAVVKAKPTAKTKAKPKASEKKVVVRKPVEKPKTKVAAKPKRKGMQIPPSRNNRKDELLRIVRANIDKKSQTAGKSAETESTKGKQQLTKKVETLQSAKNATAKPELGAKAGKPKLIPPSSKRLLQLENADLAQPAKPEAQEKSADAAIPEAKQTPTKPVKVAKKRSKPVKRIKAPTRKEESMVDMVMGMVDQFLGNQLMLMIGGGLVVIGGAIGMLYVRRRGKSLSDFEESILTSDDYSTADISTGSEDVAGNSSDTSFLSDFSQGGMGNISTDEVDPIAEADVYLAYGRDEQAEDILKEAILKSPARHELKEKLLELYSQRGDVGAFETLAEELYAALEGKGGDLWNRISAMGSALNSGNPMFQGGAPAPAATVGGGDTTPAMDFGGALEMTTPPTEAAPGADEGLAIDLSEMQEEAAAPEIDMDVGGLEMDIGTAGATEETQVVSDDALEGLEFNLDIGTADEVEAAPAPAAETASDNEISFEVAAEAAGVEVEGLSMDEEDDFAALRDNNSDNNESDLSISIDLNEADSALDISELETSLDVSELETSLDASELDTGLDMADLADDSGLGLSMEGDTASDSEVAIAPEVEEVGATSGLDSADQWDEAATKLDLAKAYIDMGDAEGARSILEEVAVEGNDDQKRQAAELASQV